MNHWIISLGNQSFPAVEELNNAEKDNYVLFFFSMYIWDAKRFLPRKSKNQTFLIVII